MKLVGMIATVSVALLSGLASGYAIAHWRLTREYEVKVDTEIEEMRQYMEAKYRDQVEDEEGEEDEESDAYIQNQISIAIADLKNEREEGKIADRDIKDDEPYFRYYSNGDPDTGEEGEHVDMSEEDTPTTRVNRTVSTSDYEIVDQDKFNAHTYDTTLHFTYYYDEELLVDFWKAQIDDDDRHIYIGDIEFTRPEAWEDESDLYILNHVEKMAVHVNISVLPIPDEVYERHEAYIKQNFKEKHEGQ